MAAASSSPSASDPLVRLALPKGRMKDGVFTIFEEAGMKISIGNDRAYRVSISHGNFDTKLLKPQNILGMLVQGSRDIGFAGYDWVRELKLDGKVVEVFDTKLDPVRLVVASPDPDVLSKGVGLGGRKLVVASEYIEITNAWIKEKGLEATFVRTWGATESLPPEDADIIVDNTATGSTLKANGLTIVDTIMHSSTRMYASPRALENPETKGEIDKLVMLLQSVLDARSRKMVTFNLIKDEASLDEIIAKLPCARMPTVSHLYHSGGFAVQIAVASREIPALLPKIKEWGGTDIAVAPIQQLMS